MRPVVLLNANMKRPAQAAVATCQKRLHACTKRCRQEMIHRLVGPQIAAIHRLEIKATAVKSSLSVASRKASVPHDQDGTWMVVGLGNPGPQYSNTRHNVGFMVVDELARAEGVDMRKLECKAQVGKGTIQDKKVILAKPITFMNVSGESVAELSRYYKVPAARILVVSDDLDLPVAAVRLRQKGGHGGHNGLRSIMQHLQGTHDFPRLKIGIGRPQGQLPVASYVLQPFSKEQQQEVGVAVQEGVAAIRAVLHHGIEKAVSGVRL